MRLLVPLLGVLLLLGCQGGGKNQGYEASAVIAWNTAQLDAIRATGIGPPQSARQLAIVSTAMYDAWTAYHDRALGTELGATLRRPMAERTVARRREAVSRAAYLALLDQYPTEAPRFAAVLEQQGYAPVALPRSGTPAWVAEQVVAALLTRRHHDGANQLGDRTANGKPYADPSGYVPLNAALVCAAPAPNGFCATPGRWQPLTFINATGATVTPAFLVPYWGEVEPFALEHGSAVRPSPPPAWDSAEHAVEVAELLTLSASLGDREKAIADFWANGPRQVLPPGHWNLHAQWVAARDRHGLDRDVLLFFALNNALMDAGIAAWDAKRAYDYWRPITAIRLLHHGQTITAWGGPGQGPQSLAAEAWQPFQPSTAPTPPFGEYVSGHSTFSAAAAAVLKSFTGSDRFGANAIVPAGSCAAEPGAPSADVVLTWSTFSAAAAEAGQSRLYGGIHFRAADREGRAMGSQIGAAAWRRADALHRGDPVCGASPVVPSADG